MVFCLAIAFPTFALETDQFTVPPQPLVDIGPALDTYVLGVIADAVREANDKAAWHERAARRAPWGFWKGHHRARAARFRSEDYLARRVFDVLGRGGVFECPVEGWVRRQAFGGGPALFLPPANDSAYGRTPLARRVLLAKMSPTVNAHRFYLGTDKIGHFFQQGYQYYREYGREAGRHGGSERSALARAVRHGVRQERGFYGEATVGIYSNADLAANYAGLKFYLNLTRAVDVGGESLPSVLVRADDGGWRFSDARANDLLRPFFGDHFNEALNPCRYAGDLRGPVRAHLRDHSKAVVAFFQCSVEGEGARQLELSTWYGEAYGHSGPDGLVTIADTCFAPGHSENQD